MRGRSRRRCRRSSRRIDRLTSEDSVPPGRLRHREGHAVRAPAGHCGHARGEPSPGLTHLQAAEFLYETSLFPGLEYTFKHALTREVAYGSVLQDHRRPLHARIAQAIEALYPERLTEQVERLAHHAVRGEVREKAVHYLWRSGIKAAGRSALPDARVWFERALSVLAEMPESPSTLEQAVDIRLELHPVLALLKNVGGDKHVSWLPERRERRRR
jgi:predicted ATPase